MTITPETAVVWARLPMGNLTGMRISLQASEPGSHHICYTLSSQLSSQLSSSDLCCNNAAARCWSGSFLNQQAESLHDGHFRAPSCAVFYINS